MSKDLGAYVTVMTSFLRGQPQRPPGARSVLSIHKKDQAERVKGTGRPPLTSKISCPEVMMARYSSTGATIRMFRANRKAYEGTMKNILQFKIYPQEKKVHAMALAKQATGVWGDWPPRKERSYEGPSEASLGAAKIKSIYLVTNPTLLLSNFANQSSCGIVFSVMVTE
jgi:hypothetical protein